jgi:predicted amidohydrolase
VTGTVVACCQLAPVLGAPAANRELTSGAITRAAEHGASVVVLPELASSGYVFESTAEAAACAEAADGETVTSWARLAARYGIVIVGGFCEASGGEVFNSAALVDPDGLRCVYRKAHLWDSEARWFTPGRAAPPVVPTRFGRLAVMICYDLEFPEWVRLPALDGAQLLCAPTNWPAAPRPAGERPSEVVRVQARNGASAGSAARSSWTRTAGRSPPPARPRAQTRRSRPAGRPPTNRSPSPPSAGSARLWTRPSAR